jgi:fatty acid desaturase
MKNHKFSPCIVRQVAQELKSNNYSGILQVVEDWSVVFCAILLTQLAFSYQNLVLSFLCYLFSVIVIGGRQRALADLLHQSSHGCLADNAWLNYALGTFVSGYTVLQSFSIYRKSHVLLHHPWLGNPFHDPDYMGLISNKICGRHRSPARTQSYIYSLLAPLNSVHYLRYLVQHRIYNKTEYKLETVVRTFFFASVLYFLIVHQLCTLFLLFWMVPMVSSNVWIGSLLELFEHFPMIDDHQIEYKDIYLSRNRIWSFLTNFMLGVHWEGYHLVHHLFPKIPSWNYERVHCILMQDPVYQQLDHQRVGWISTMQQIIQNS